MPQTQSYLAANEGLRVASEGNVVEVGKLQSEATCSSSSSLSLLHESLVRTPRLIMERVACGARRDGAFTEQPF